MNNYNTHPMELNSVHQINYIATFTLLYGTNNHDMRTVHASSHSMSPRRLRDGISGDRPIS